MPKKKLSEKLKKHYAKFDRRVDYYGGEIEEEEEENNVFIVKPKTDLAQEQEPLGEEVRAEGSAHVEDMSKKKGEHVNMVHSEYGIDLSNYLGSDIDPVNYYGKDLDPLEYVRYFKSYLDRAHHHLPEKYVPLEEIQPQYRRRHHR